MQMHDANERSFSKKWMAVSVAIFICVELILAGLVGNVVAGRFLSRSLHFIMQGALNLVSFLIGGFIIGLISPGIRIHEPAVGAFLSVSIMLCLSIFTPYSFIHFSLAKMIVGGVIAFSLALVGARLGEKISGTRVR